MSYRDPLAALRHRREHVAAELAASRRAADEARAQEARCGLLAKELAEVEAILRDAATVGAAPTRLEDIRIASPCHARWEDMAGDDRVRFCGQCSKNVYNLSAMPRAEAEALVLEREGSLCARFYRRADGTVLTADCPTGERKKRRRLALLAVAGGGLMAAGAAIGMAHQEHAMGSIEPARADMTPDPDELHPVMGAPRSQGVLQERGQKEQEAPAAPAVPENEHPFMTTGVVSIPR